MNLKIETKCIHGFRHENPEGAIATPIFQSATFAHPAVGESTGYDYSRQQNPTREAVEKMVASLEGKGHPSGERPSGGTEALGFPTGMAALTTLMEMFRPGDHIISTEDLYGGSIRLFENISRKNGIEVDFVDTRDLTAFEALIKENTKAIFIETPTNPMMHITDIAAIKKIAGQILVIVDNTFLTPYFQRPLELGADIVLHSGTKYLSGHNDTMAGFLVLSDPGLIERLRLLHKTMGACLSPFDSFLVMRGIKTLALRMEKSQENAKQLAKWLQEKGKTVHYPGIGAMISFETENAAEARKILEGVKLIRFAESLGGVETLITYPMLQTHADVPANEREARGINDRLLRISVGIEHIDDLIFDLSHAFK